jgi:hypothetical protein
MHEFIYPEPELYRYHYTVYYKLFHFFYTMNASRYLGIVKTTKIGQLEAITDTLAIWEYGSGRNRTFLSDPDPEIITGSGSDPP